MYFGQFLIIKKKAGFTLVEVIVSLVVAGILGAMLTSFMSNSVMQSPNPVLMTRSGSYLNAIMENIGADYRRLIVTSATPLTTLENRLASNKSLYGENFSVVTKRFDFPTGTGTVTEPSSASASGKILKVTIIYNNLSLTSLYAE